MFEHRCTVDEERLKVLESQLKEARNTVEESDKKCDEVSIIEAETFDTRSEIKLFLTDRYSILSSLPRKLPKLKMIWSAQRNEYRLERCSYCYLDFLRNARSEIDIL